LTWKGWEQKRELYFRGEEISALKTRRGEGRRKKKKKKKNKRWRRRRRRRGGGATGQGLPSFPSATVREAQSLSCLCIILVVVTLVVNNAVCLSTFFLSRNISLNIHKGFAFLTNSV
jgi:hypothetical protein